MRATDPRDRVAGDGIGVGGKRVTVESEFDPRHGRYRLSLDRDRRNDRIEACRRTRERGRSVKHHNQRMRICLQRIGNGESRVALLVGLDAGTLHMPTIEFEYDRLVREQDARCGRKTRHDRRRRTEVNRYERLHCQCGSGRRRTNSDYRASGCEASPFPSSMQIQVERQVHMDKGILRLGSSYGGRISKE